MTTAAFGARYEEGLQAFLVDRAERSLRTAYELGREAVQAELSVLDVAAAHNGAMARALRGASAERSIELVDAGGDFLVEALSAFEMVQRGLTETRRAAFEERRRARMLRALSSVLADSSLAAGDAGSIAELAQLVAEYARELTKAEVCVVHISAAIAGADTTATARSDGVDTWSDLFAPTADEIAATPEGPPDIVRVPLATLAGVDIGHIEATSAAPSFSDDDQATLVQIAQMTGAGVERARLHRS
jgi:hypothetical protein